MFQEIFTYTAQPNLRFVLMGFVVGIAAACLGMLYQMKWPGRMIRTLIRAGADTPEKALRAAELGFKSEWLLRFMLSERGAAHKYVGIVPGRVITKKKKKQIVMLEARYYILPETKLRASMRYDAKNANVVTVVIAIVLFAVAAVILAAVIPELLQMLKNVFSG
ncbi:MAG: hypothetical protein HFE78_00355 [Clostridiales bacterium]|nr:hypothetical protein [Clostridiales bacterium]